MSNIKYIAITLFLLIPSLSFANSRVFLCDVGAAALSQSVELSVNSPALDFHQKFTERNGQVNDKIERLVTDNAVSSYNVPRAACAIQMAKSRGNESFNFNFSCKGLEGFLTFDAVIGVGEYYQRLTSFNVVRTFRFKNCVAI
jgi:hypothetical protein